MAKERVFSADASQVAELSTVLVALVRAGRVVDVNVEGARLLGGRTEDVLGRSLESFVEPRDRGILTELMRSAASTNATSMPASRYVRIQRLDGTNAPMELRACAPSGATSDDVLVAAHEVSSTRAMHAGLAKIQEMARRALTMEASVHSINNPLASVLACLEQLADRFRISQDRTQDEATLIVHQALADTQRVVSAVRELAALQTLASSRDPFDPSGLVATLLPLFEADISPRAHLSAELSVVPTIAVDQARLTYLLLHLIERRTSMLVRDDGSVERHVVMRTSSEGEVVRIHIDDDGEPIVEGGADAWLGTDSEDASGAMLLASVLERMGGTLDVGRSTLGGARLTLEFPAHVKREEHDLVASRPRRRSAPPKGELRILIVDDETSIHRALERTLRDLGMIQSVRSGRAAVELLQGGATFDVVLSDLIMENGSGIELAQWLAEHRPELKRRLILMTGAADTQTAAEPDVLTVAKPFDTLTLKELIVQVSARG